MPARDESTLPEPIRWLSPAIAAPVRYRIGNGEWLPATMVEIGRLTVVIRTRHCVPMPNTAIDLRVTVPAGEAGPAPREIVCAGSVVRIGRSSRAGERLVAVAIDD